MCLTGKTVGLLIAWLVVAWGCRPEPAAIAPIVNTKTVLPSQAALVSVQPTGAATAEVIVKLTSAVGASDWRLTALTASGAAVPLQPGATELLDRFSLSQFSLSGLTAGQTYTLRLGFRYNKKDTLTVERTYTHAVYNPWKRRAHLPFDSGLFTGSIIDFSADRSGSSVRVTRYVDAETWGTAIFDNPRNQWFRYTPPDTTVRRGLAEYVLYWHNKDRHYFYGLGYQTDELLPGKSVYRRDLFAILPPASMRCNSPSGRCSRVWWSKD